MKLAEIRESFTGIDTESYDSRLKPMFALIQYKPTGKPRQYEFGSEQQVLLQTPQWCTIETIYINDSRGPITTPFPNSSSKPYLVPHTREILAIMTYEEACKSHPELVI